ncbi:deSI-like protein [Hibiscus syriacus]|uniref:DeSI-like protein n=1 Tax=Hibiscus syriacus TaxID=106335 RepID=A0A6A2YSV5_HIBSY|nr:deSI-like protein [Hibiscus syriacus]
MTLQSHHHSPSFPSCFRPCAAADNSFISPPLPSQISVFWDLSRAKFGSGPEPNSGFYIAILVDGEMTLLVGDSAKEAYAKSRAQKPGKSQALVMRREHVLGNKVYNTKARFGGKSREISIDFKADEDGKLCFTVDNKRVLQVKRLKWKFRGNERIEVDGVSIQVSWDVCNWLFVNDLNNGHAVFMFKFENEGSEILGADYQQDGTEVVGPFNEKNGVVLWQQSSCNLGVNGAEWKKMGKSLMRTAISSSSSSISMSSSSSGVSSSVMEWASVEENELSAPTGFSFLVYAWKK